MSFFPQVHDASPQVDLDVRESFLLPLVRKAGELAHEAFASDAVSYEMKGPQDFLTETDAAVERLIRQSLATAFPEDGFIGEETGVSQGAISWVVDPIDGTANFARRIPHYCISIALVSDGDILLGTIYDPEHDELYVARKGRGATRNGIPITTSETVDARSACIELGWSTRVPNAAYLRVMERILSSGANVRRAATGALGLAYVADGRSDAYAELHMNAWDCLAGLLMVKEAGGKVSQFLKEGALTKGGAVLASTRGIAALMSEASGIAYE